MVATRMRLVATLVMLVALGANCSSDSGGETVAPETSTTVTAPGSVAGSSDSIPDPGPPVSAVPSTPTTDPASVVDAPVALRDDVALVNLRPRDTPFGALTPWPEGIGYVRAWGGSRGMVTFPTDDAVPTVLRDRADRGAFDVVTDDEIAGLLDLQELHGVRLVYMVNINDTLDSQITFIERLQSVGIDIAMFEMGNELYLPKFANGDATKLGVTRSWSEQEYLQLLRSWGPALRAVDAAAPIYAVAAAYGTTGSASDLGRANWNDVLRSAIELEPDLVDGVTFHVYAGAGVDAAADTGEEPITANADDALRSLGAFGDLPVAVTESGYRFTDEQPTGLDDAERFWASLRAALRPGDLFGIHVMYGGSNGPSSPHYALFDDHGRTAVGDRFANWLATWAAPISPT